MKIIYKIIILLFTINIVCFSQSTIITPGNTQPNITASSTTNGIVLPRMTTTQKNAISTLIAGMMVYDLDSNCVSVFNGNLWSCFKSNGSSNNGSVQIPLFTQSQINSFSPQIGTLAYNTTTEALYSSDGNKMNPVGIEYLDGNEIQTSVSTAWANGNKIPIFRLRHLNNTSGVPNSTSIAKDFKIFPYEAGMAVEYNGVLENWVGQFSIQRGYNYFDQGDGGNGWGGILWVGNDNDTGGVRITARNNIFYGGNLKFTEISSEQYNQNSAGNLRLRLVDDTDRIDFVFGKRGSNNVVSSIGQTGIKFPSINNVSSIASPMRGLTVFDDADSTMKVFTGAVWGDLNTNKFIGQTGIKFPSINNVSSIASPIKGLTVFDNADSTMKVYTGAVWGDLNNQRLTGSDSISNNKTLSYTSKQVQYVDASNGNIIITLPLISDNSSGLIFKIIRVDGSSNSITVSVTDSSNTINGLSSKNIQYQFDCINLYAKGKNKWIATREMGY